MSAEPAAAGGEGDSLTHSPTHSLTHSLTHSHTHPRRLKHSSRTTHTLLDRTVAWSSDEISIIDISKPSEDDVHMCVLGHAGAGGRCAPNCSRFAFVPLRQSNLEQLKSSPTDFIWTDENNWFGALVDVGAFGLVDSTCSSQEAEVKMLWLSYLVSRSKKRWKTTGNHSPPTTSDGFCSH